MTPWGDEDRKTGKRVTGINRKRWRYEDRDNESQRWREVNAVL